MRNLEIKNIKSHPSLSLAKANASRDLQINFNQAEDALTIPAESRHDHKCGSATQSGRSMIEMLGVLAIIGVLSVGGIAGYSKAMHKYRINKAIEQITLMASNIRTFFAPQKNYIGVYCSCSTTGCAGHSDLILQGYSPNSENGCPIVKKAKLIPDEMLTVNSAGEITAITNPFGNRVDLDYAAKSQSKDYQAFYIYYLTDGSYETCIELMSYDWSIVGIKGIRLRNGPSPLPSVTVPVSMDIAVAKCSNQYGNRGFEFYVDVSDNCWNDTRGYICS